MTKTTYVATAPDGSQHTRKTDRTYTHAVLLESEEEWTAVGFCGRPDLAEKKRSEHPGSIVVKCSVLGDRAADMPEAEATEKASDSPSEQPKPTIGSMVQELLMDEALDYATIVDAVVAEFPNAQTSARSVASVASVLRKKGVDVPMRRNSKV
ncbi:hypothetical protein [Jannaschia rubra]|uniref:Uncharacterized protein n=1 Tax=Jannaschia rubra TaxID=282197 RepID=A0A0M6XS39_9RHOB|nr:hypothetical protein [Jannaschia rubra]CTQ33910.1 hypothetical protein JAN5088_02699 [Jannaschia rubra]SFG76010.1 hypothetical protein SAMN04488517_11412 [Jannaschia rubra]